MRLSDLWTFETVLVRCGCGHEGELSDVTGLVRRYGRDRSVESLRRALRCAWCGRRDNPRFVGLRYMSGGAAEVEKDSWAAWEEKQLDYSAHGLLEALKRLQNGEAVDERQVDLKVRHLRGAGKLTESQQVALGTWLNYRRGQ